MNEIEILREIHNNIIESQDPINHTKESIWFAIQELESIKIQSIFPIRDIIQKRIDYLKSLTN